jgi:hypothetical protein
VRAAIAGAALVAGLALAGPALGKTTADFKFTSKGQAVTPSAAGDPNAASSHEDIPFTIAADDTDGAVSVAINWANPADDFDLYVYRKEPDNSLTQVGSSAGAPPDTQENAVVSSQGVPLRPGAYIARVVNYASSNPSFTGFAKFSPFTPPNEIPKAALKAPSSAKAGKAVTLDASKSKDVDGKIVDYAFDLDGDGAMDVDNHGSPKLKRKLSPGIHYVAVRVTDGKGARGFANRTIVVRKAKHKK